MSIIEDKCKEKGVRLTDQRKVIAKILSESKEQYGSKDHPDVDELHKRVTKIDDKISIATVYRTVKLFEEAGILIKHDFKTGKARYEINDDQTTGYRSDDPARFTRGIHGDGTIMDWYRPRHAGCCVGGSLSSIEVT